MSNGNVFLNRGFVAAKPIPRRAVSGAYPQHGRTFLGAGEFGGGHDCELFLHHRLIVLFVDQRIVGTARGQDRGKGFQTAALFGNADFHGPEADGVAIGSDFDGGLVPFEAGHGKITGGDQDHNEND